MSQTLDENSMKFTCAMCVWKGDHESAFREAVASCLNQEVKPSQIVLVVDGPVSAGLNSVIDELKVDSIRENVELTLFRFVANVGHGIARSKSIELSDNEVIAICDADDINQVYRFRIQRAYLNENPNVSVVGGYIEEFSRSFDLIVKKGIRMVPLSQDDVESYIRFRCPMNQMTVMFRKNDVMEVGGYQDFYHNEDYYLWCRLLLANKKMANIPRVLVRALVSDDTYERRGGVNYFISESKIQFYMYKNKMTNIFLVLYSILIRMAMQVLIPASIRKYIFQRFMRE